MEPLNLQNKVFGYLTVLEKANNIKTKTSWLCKCICNKTKIVTTDKLVSNKIKSCGCKQRKPSKYKKKHNPHISSAKTVFNKNYSDSNLTFEQFLDLSTKNCYYCNSPPLNKQNSSTKKSSTFSKENGTFIYNGLDRIDNSKPHSIDNVVTCCKYCNYSKRERSIEEFKSWIINVYNNFINKNPN